MDILQFGIPTRGGAAKVEKHPTTPVLTIEPSAVLKGQSSKITLNPTAITTLGLDHESDVTQEVSFAFSEDVLIGNTSGNESIPEKDRYRVFKNGTISNKRLHNYLASLEGMGIGEYELIAEPNGTFKLVTVGTIQPESNMTNEAPLSFEAPAETEEEFV
jgi:hypothetical protein